MLFRLCSRSMGEIRATKPSILSCACVELEPDMKTVRGEREGLCITVVSGKADILSFTLEA